MLMVQVPTTLQKGVIVAEDETIRPTKKQKELLGFIETFIAEHGYSPSYREIKNALNYSSVATVALHIANLVKRGHLVKRDNAARSLEPLHKISGDIKNNRVTAAEEKWLVGKVEHFFTQAEQANPAAENAINELYVLVGSLKILGLEGAAQSFIPRLATLKHKLEAGRK